MKRIGIAMLAVALSTGCVPRMQPDIPELTGIVERSGSPVAGATILVAERWAQAPCSSARPVAETDHLGRFAFKGKRSLHLAVVAADPKQYWEMCVQIGEKVWFGARPAGFGLQKSIDLGTCDVTHEPTPPKDPRDGGICGR